LNFNFFKLKVLLPMLQNNIKKLFYIPILPSKLHYF
jgi:hypothetical protein